MPVHRHPPGSRPPAQRGRRPRRGQRGVLLQARARRPSAASPPSALDAIARALQLDDADGPTSSTSPSPPDGIIAAHATATDGARGRGPRGPQPHLGARQDPPPGHRPQRPDGSARHQRLGRAMHGAVYDEYQRRQPNFARFTFLDLDAARDFYPHWERRRRHVRRHPAHRGRPRPARQGRCTTSSASCPPGAATSAAAGEATMSGCTALASGCSIMGSSGPGPAYESVH